MKRWGAALAVGPVFVGLWCLIAPALPARSREEAWLILAIGRLLAVPAALAAASLAPHRGAAIATSLFVIAIEFLVGPLLAGWGLEANFLSGWALQSFAWFAPLAALYLASRAWIGEGVATVGTLAAAAALFFAPFAMDVWLIRHQGDWDARGLIAFIGEHGPAPLGAQALGFELFKNEALYHRYLVGEQLSVPLDSSRAATRALGFTIGALLVAGCGWGWRLRSANTRTERA